MSVSESAIKTVSRNRSFGGMQGVYSHASKETGCAMRFGVFLPSRAESDRVPVLYWLSGLTCTEENFIVKAGAQRIAEEIGLAIVVPDTSPRGLGVPGEADSYDFDSVQASMSMRRSRRGRAAIAVSRRPCRAPAGGGREKFPDRYRTRRYLRAFHGRARRTDHCAQESARLPFCVGLRSDCVAHALSMGSEGVDGISRRRSFAMAQVRHDGAHRRPRLVRTADRRRSGNGRSVSRESAQTGVAARSVRTIWRLTRLANARRI